MDITSTYRQLIRDALRRTAALYQAHAPEGIEEVLVFDEASWRYLWLESGWENRQRVQRVVIHARVQDEQIWIEEDWTEDGIATQLMQEHVPPAAIVLAFHDPASRTIPPRLSAEETVAVS